MVKNHLDAEHLDGVDAGDVEAGRGALDLAKIARAEAPADARQRRWV